MRSRLASCVLLVVLTSLVPRIVEGQASDPKKDPAAGEKQPPASGFLESRTFELLIVGPDGKPVPNAQFEIRMGPKPQGWVFHRGEQSSKTSRYGTIATTDGVGAAAFEIPATGIEYFSINATNPGFGPFWAQWNPGENTSLIPKSYTVHLDAGVSVGGITVDDQGRPIAGVTIHPSIEFKKRDDDLSQLAIGDRVKSDENGRWVYRSVPASFEALTVRVDHPEYMGAQGLRLPLKEYTVPPGAEATRPIVVPRGETVAGAVVGADGKPVAGARIRTKFGNSEREAVTDAEGIYELKGCKPGSAVIFATAKGHGPETASVNIRSGMPPVDFRLPAPKTIRIRAVDGEGRPIPKFRVFFRQWRDDDYGYGLGMQLVYANDQGVWEWNEAPADAFVADICPPNRTQLSDQHLVARDEDYVFRFSDASLPTTVFGSVVDRITGQPIPKFRVVPGLGGFNSGVLWDRGDTFDGKDGKFYFRAGYPRPGFQFRVEAPGYLTADSEYVESKGGNSNVQVQLTPGEWLSSRVMLPSGEPAVGAIVAIGIAGTQIYFRDGEFSESGSYCDRRTVDAEGKFEFPSQVGRFEVFVVHPDGWAMAAGDPGEKLKSIELTPWARVRGVVKVGPDAARDVAVTLDHQASIHDPARPRLSLSYDATSGADGSFEWNRVFPGMGTISKEIRYHVTPRGYHTSRSHAQQVEFRPGEEVKVTIGGSGRALAGAFAAPDSLKSPPDWNFAFVELQTRGMGGPYCTTVQPDGKFRLDDIPAGTYTLDVRLHAPGATGFGPGELLATLEHPVSIPASDKMDAAVPIDPGTLTLKAVGGK